MTNKIRKSIKQRKKNLLLRLMEDGSVRAKPMICPDKIKYDFSEKIQGMNFGGIGVVLTFLKNSGLIELLDEKLHFFKIHKPYHESDHILNLMLNTLCGGECLDDLELLRNNPAYLDALGAVRIPDPTTAGDFLRRFFEDDILKLLQVNNEINQRVWKFGNTKTKKEIGIIDVDGKLEKTYGECKEGIDMTYKGFWGFSNLLLTEATTGVHLYSICRPGNYLSHTDAIKWIDKGIKLVGDNFSKVFLRGDTDYSLTKHFDRWNEDQVTFTFGYSAYSNLVKIARSLDNRAWKRIYRQTIEGRTLREKKERYKEQKVIEREYLNKRLSREYVSEIDYKPGKCKNTYRLIIVKKVIKVTKGYLDLDPEIRYFFYITNDWDKTPEEVVKFIRGRCNHENKIEQMANGVHAMKMPVSELNANWAFMVISMMAWNLKCWLGMVNPNKDLGREMIKMEFKKFRNRIINFSAQIIKAGGEKIFRIINYHPDIESLLELFEYIKKLRLTPT